jgi:hypothetical protein
LPCVGTWLSLVEHSLGVRGVGSSNLPVPTIKIIRLTDQTSARFRPANISLINRRHYLPRLLLTLSLKRQMQKLFQPIEDIDKVTPYQFPVCQPPC